MSIQEMQERREYLLRAWACGMIDRQDARRGISVLTAEIEKAALRAQKKAKGKVIPPAQQNAPESRLRAEKGIAR